MDVRPQRVIDLKEYKCEGEITLEPLDFRRRRTLQNNIGKSMHFKNGNMDMIEAQDLGDITVYKVMAYIVSAPFGFGQIEGFYKFMDRLDR